MRRSVFWITLSVAINSGVVLAANDARTATTPVTMAGNRTENYKLAPGDKLKVTVFDVPEMTGEYVIGPAGIITLPLIGDVRAGGGSTQVLTGEIRKSLEAGFVKQANVTVAVISYRPFYILGEINKPGEFAYSANLTVEQAIAAAGGYTYRAARHKAFLRRAGGPELVVKFRADPVYVMPGDTIRIGERYL